MQHATPPPPPPARRPARRGSVLVLVLVTAVALGIILGPMMQLTVAETKLNERAVLTMEANNAAESIVEYGMAELKQRWDNQVNFPLNELSIHPLSLPSTLKSLLWTGTNVNTTTATITGGVVPPGQWIFIDPSDPANAFDPQRGKLVWARNVMVYSKATAANKFGNTTAYAAEALQVRDAPLFAHAIFYNMDLEFHPGPYMSITGPVHSNGNVWLVCNTGGGLDFSGPLTTAQGLHVGMMPAPTSWGSYSDGATKTAKIVTLPNAAGVKTHFYKGSGSEQLASSYYDSRQTNYNGTGYTNWREFSSNKWAGSIQSTEHGVPKQNIVGYQDYVPDANGDGNRTDDLNYAYAIIEPNMANPNTNPNHKGVGENDKFARKAGLIMRVHPVATSNTTLTFSGNTGAAVTGVTNNVTITIGNNNLITASYTGNVSGGNAAIANTALQKAINYVLMGVSNNTTSNSANPLAYTSAGGYVKTAAIPTHAVLLTNFNVATNSTAANTTATIETFNGTAYLGGNATNVMQSTSGSGNSTVTTRRVGYAWVSFNELQTNVAANGLRTTVYQPGTSIQDAFGNTMYQGDVIEQPVKVDPAALASGNLSNLVKFRPGVVNPGNTTDMWQGLYDGRRGENISLVELDMGKVRRVLDNTEGSYNTSKAAFFRDPATGNATYNPNDKFNGVFYVEFPTVSSNVTRPDKIVISADKMGLAITNTTVIPNPSYNNPAITANAQGRNPGFTLATNNALYTVGHYNSDGNMNTPVSDTSANVETNSTMPDGTGSWNPNVPSALVADSITNLSNAWLHRNSLKATNTRTATSTEVTAAFLTGLVPSLKESSSQQSGGSHNFPRFLEDWSGDVFRYRGSMVALFESEVGDDPFGGGYYSPPTRQYGFYNEFAEGRYPPGSPNARSYYRVNFQVLSKAEYDAAIAALP